MGSSSVSPSLQTRARPAGGVAGLFLQPGVPLEIQGRQSHHSASQQETGETLKLGLSEEGLIRG